MIYAEKSTANMSLGVMVAVIVQPLGLNANCTKISQTKIIVQNVKTEYRKGVTTMANELKHCPFCGGKAEIRTQPLYTENGVCIRCTKCNARSRFVLFDCVYEYYHGEAKVYIPKERAIKDVIDLWNRRVTDGE